MTDKSALSRQERKFYARWEQILRSAAILFATKGYHRTTTKEIAEAADVSEGTLYNYFESKNDLLFGIVGQLAKSQEEEDWLTASPSSDLRQFFVTLLRQRGGFAEQNQAMLQAVLSEILADAQLRERFYQQVVQPTIHMVEKQLQLRVQLGQIRPIDVPMTARFVAALWNGLFLMRVLGDPITQTRWDELSEVIAAITFDGVAVSKAQSAGADSPKIHPKS